MDDEHFEERERELANLGKGIFEETLNSSILDGEFIQLLSIL
jgi:hypothetical protein